MSKVTPKKLYCANEKDKRSCCRLWLNICDMTHVKKFFKPTNANIIKLAEDCLGDNLIRNQNLPQISADLAKHGFSIMAVLGIWSRRDRILSSHNSGQKDAPIHCLVDCQRQRELNSSPFHFDGHYTRPSCGLQYQMDYTRIKETNITMSLPPLHFNLLDLCLCFNLCHVPFSSKVAP